jgi:hypothetical protein
MAFTLRNVGACRTAPAQNGASRVDHTGSQVRLGVVQVREPTAMAAQERGEGVLHHVLCRQEVVHQKQGQPHQRHGGARQPGCGQGRSGHGLDPLSRPRCARASRSVGPRRSVLAPGLRGRAEGGSPGRGRLQRRGPARRAAAAGSRRPPTDSPTDHRPPQTANRHGVAPPSERDHSRRAIPSGPGTSQFPALPPGLAEPEDSRSRLKPFNSLASTSRADSAWSGQRWGPVTKLSAQRLTLTSLGSTLPTSLAFESIHQFCMSEES